MEFRRGGDVPSETQQPVEQKEKERIDWAHDILPSEREDAAAHAMEPVTVQRPLTQRLLKTIGLGMTTERPVPLPNEQDKENGGTVTTGPC
jgi:hypothetical protein